MHRHAALAVALLCPLFIRVSALAQSQPVRESGAGEARRKAGDHRAAAHRLRGIERGIHTHLEGLQYEMPVEGLLPDARLAQWVRSMASANAQADRGATMTPAATSESSHH